MSAVLAATASPSHEDLRSLVLVLAAAAAAAFLARMIPGLTLPTVVPEIVLGILIGPEVFGWATDGPYVRSTS